SERRMFSRTESPSNTLGTCVFIPRLLRAIRWGAILTMLLSARRTSPVVGTICPVRHLKNVLFPAPFGPIMQHSSSGFRLKLMSDRATTPPKCTDKLVTVKRLLVMAAPLETVEAVARYLV